jgi:CRP-like cAMP-binding protein
MISPETLRRYPFFGVFDDRQLIDIAMITEEQAFQAGESILEEAELAETFFLLVNGSVELYFAVKVEFGSGNLKELPIGDINPGEPFGISALIEPFIYRNSARASKNSQVIKIDAVALRNFCDQNQPLAYKLMQQIAKAALERLNATRVLLAAAWA